MPISTRPPEAVHEQRVQLVSTARSPAKLNIVGDASSAFAVIYLTDTVTRKRTPESDERARRLAACWNALVGMSTEDVEAMAVENLRKREALAADEACLSTLERSD